MGIEEVPTPTHWNYFLAIEDDIDRLSRYLELTETNFPAYSLELARILFCSSSEIDVVAKQFCKQINLSSNADNISKYRELIVAHYPQITQTRVHLPKFGLTLNPWEEWIDKSPIWWRAYNNVKHHRHTHFPDANLKNSLNATAALFVLLLLFYKTEAAQGQLNPDPRLFRAGSPFKVDNLFYAPHTFTYQLLTAG